MVLLWSLPQPFILSTCLSVCLSVYTAYSNSFVLCFFSSVTFPLLLTGRPAGGLRENYTHSRFEVQKKNKDFTQGLSIIA
jgi:hypothetical protein